MNENDVKQLVEVQNNQPVTSSRNVAEHFGKDHRHVLDAIRALEKGMPKNGQTPEMFFETTYVNEQNGQTYPMYLMNRDGFTLLVMGFNGAKALEWKLKYIEAFNKMEKAVKTPQVTPNPHYRTRMIATAVKDIGKTAEAMEKVFAVKHGMALAASMDMVGEAYGIDTTPMRRLIPAEENPGTLNATQLAEKLGFQYKNGKPNPAECNKFLESHGFQEKQGKTWRLTKNGKGYAEEKPFSRNGHSGYNIAWQMNVVDILRRMMAAEQPA